MDAPDSIIVEEPIARILYFCDSCEPTALLKPQDLLRYPMPTGYPAFLRAALTACPVFAYAIGDYHFAIGFSKANAFIFDLRSTIHRDVLDTDAISEVSIHELPFYYNKTNTNLEIYHRGSGKPAGHVATISLPPAAILIDFVLLSSTLVLFFVKESRPSTLFIAFRQDLMASSNTVTRNLSIELSGAPVYTTASTLHFVAVDRSGVLILGELSSLSHDMKADQGDAAAIPIPLSTLCIRHTWSDNPDQAVLSGDVPTCCAVSSELGLVALTTTSGKLALYDIGLNPIAFTPGDQVLDLKRLLSITPVVFRMLFIDRQLVIIFERAPPLLIQLSEHINQQTFFVHHLFSAQPYSALPFTVKDPHILLAAADRCAAQLAEQKPKAIPPRGQPDGMDILVGIWENTMGADALRLFTDGMEDLVETRIDALKCKLLSTFTFIDDSSLLSALILSPLDEPRLSVTLLCATERVAQLLIQTDQAEGVIQLGLQLHRSKIQEIIETGAAILHNAYYYCMSRSYTDLAETISYALKYNILEARPYAEHLREKEINNNPILREAESSSFYLLIERFLNGDFADAEEDVRDLGIESLFSINNIYTLLKKMDNDLLFADQNVVA